MLTAPRVTVVVATYNRSNVLQWTLRSLQRQSVTDWEAWVVGDACTDDTADVVASLGDARLRYYDLPRNVGDQSGPNNEGVRRASGSYLAFLNHDDLWFPDHLETCLRPLEADQADLVWGLADRLLPGGGRRLDGLFPHGRYVPGPIVPASSWVFRRTLAAAIGPWRHRREIRDIPSQDWLLRAWRAGTRMRAVPRVTLVVIGSGKRPGSYARRDEDEHREAFERLEGAPAWREQELERLLVDQPDSLRRSQAFLASVGVGALLRSLFYRWERRLLLALGVNPVAFYRALRLQRPGAFVDALRRRRGLSDVEPAPGTSMEREP
jgi:glycosyltransferase involved in cell wall biosynthesis